MVYVHQLYQDWARPLPVHRRAALDEKTWWKEIEISLANQLGYHWTNLIGLRYLGVQEK